MKVGDFKPALQPVKTYVKPAVEKSPDEFRSTESEALSPINWGGVAAVVGGVGLTCGLSAAGLGAASAVSAFVVGGVGGFALINQGLMKALGTGKDESAPAALSAIGGAIGGLAAAGGAAYVAASHGSPVLGLAVGVASSAAALGAGLWYRHHSD